MFQNLFVGIDSGYMHPLAFKLALMEKITIFYNEHYHQFLYFPFYAGREMDSKPKAKINPFADIKIGYQTGIDYDSSEFFWEGPK